MADNPFAARDSTLPIEGAKSSGAVVRRFRLTVLDGPKPGSVWQSQSDRCSIGFHESNDLRSEERRVGKECRL